MFRESQLNPTIYWWFYYLTVNCCTQLISKLIASPLFWTRAVYLQYWIIVFTFSPLHFHLFIAHLDRISCKNKLSSFHLEMHWRWTYSFPLPRDRFKARQIALRFNFMLFTVRKALCNWTANKRIKCCAPRWEPAVLFESFCWLTTNNPPIHV